MWLHSESEKSPNLLTWILHSVHVGQGWIYCTWTDNRQKPLPLVVTWWTICLPCKLRPTILEVLCACFSDEAKTMHRIHESIHPSCNLNHLVWPIYDWWQLVLWLILQKPLQDLKRRRPIWGSSIFVIAATWSRAVCTLSFTEADEKSADPMGAPRKQ